MDLILKRVYVLLDEIQYLDDPTNFLKLVVDHYKKIKIIACGSSVFEIREKFTKSLVGRAFVLEVFGFSFEEFLVFKLHCINEFPRRRTCNTCL